MEMNIQVAPKVVPTNVPYLAICGAVEFSLLILLLVYRIRFYGSPPIVSILALLLFNQFLMLIFEFPSYFSNLPDWACIVSITGTTFFRLAEYYWLIFVTRLVYRQKAAPGKFLHLEKYLRKTVIFTYIPSVAVTLVVLIVMNLDNTQSEVYCWRVIDEKTANDYIVYMSSFVLPNFLALIAIIVYLLAFLFVKRKSTNWICLGFPLSALPFICYDLVLKILTFVGNLVPDQLFEVPLVCQPLAHGIIFLVVLYNLAKGRSMTTSELTIKEESFQNESFIVPPQAQV